ncbi:DUF2975 domain-containing protein [Maricaulis sp.]|jgi:DUF2975 family protein|uniref:DUF2975 domain-containing protein n=1 Tax=Maricaulis TaxID=74317 RepID=UPI0025D6B053|nr:DUF2975 domain-containing protein [Maricaulis sp.]MDF1767637.1 DUF2975 domain-containing protein [Maricaulis sp.]
MKTLGSGSLVSVLKVVLDILWYLAWGLLGFAALVLIATGATLLMDWLGYSPNFLTDLFQAIRDYGGAYPILIAHIIAFLVVNDRLRRIFATLVAGDPFVPENAGHLRMIAIAIAVFQVLRYMAQGAVAMVLTLLHTDAPVVGGVEINKFASFDLGAWFAVAALLVLAEVFREGARMRQEQKLTI